MNLSNNKYAELLKSLSSHTERSEWLDGTDLYEENRIKQVQKLGELIIAKVDDGSRVPAEVHLKLHSSLSFFQWIECSCHKYKVEQKYCRHVAAAFHTLVYKHSSLLANLKLDGSVFPHRHHKTSQKKKAIFAGQQADPPPNRNFEDFFVNGQCSIQSIHWVGSVPLVQMFVDWGQNTVTSIDLDLEQTGRLLDNQTWMALASAAHPNLRLLENKAQFGFFISPSGAENISVAKVLGLPIELKKIKKQLGILQAKTSNPDDLDSEIHMLFIESKTVGLYTSENFAFIDSLGFAKLEKSPAYGDWLSEKDSLQFEDDAAAALVETQFVDLAKKGHIWLNKKLKHLHVAKLDLENISINDAGDGWFYLDPQYKSPDKTKTWSIQDLIQYAQKQNRTYIKSKDGWLKIPDHIQTQKWQPQDKDTRATAFKTNALGLLRLQVELGSFDHFVGSKSILTQLKGLHDRNYQHTTIEPDLTSSNLHLRNYQKEGLEWLLWLYENGLHGLLADDMGLGKTHQAMGLFTSLVNHYKKHDPEKKLKFLVACPMTVLDHWFDKMQSFAPNLNPLKHHGTNRDMQVIMDLPVSTVLTSYGILLRDTKHLEKINWDVILLDEAHFIKNNKTATYQAACNLESKFRLCLTGTPLENDLLELKNLFDFLVPGYLGSSEYFKQQFLNPIQSEDGLERELLLQKLLFPLKLRRTKDQVLKDLPEKVEDTRYATLSDEQIQLYRDTLNLKGTPLLSQLKASGTPIPYMHVFAVLHYLKQICNHPALLSDHPLDYGKHRSEKFELFKSLLDETIQSGNKVVVFSQYVGMIKIIEHYVESLGISCASMTGQSTSRGTLIKRFQEDPNCKVFVSTLMTGGMGIDLTAASVVIHYDRWWNASKENQATDRVHRIGQKSFVQVFKLVTKGTLEEKIALMIAKKADLFKRFLERDEEIFQSFSREDIINLLEEPVQI